MTLLTHLTDYGNLLLFVRSATPTQTHRDPGLAIEGTADSWKDS